MKNAEQIHSMPKLVVKRCCLVDNTIGCNLWEVQTEGGYTLGKFGTRTGALDFAHGRANARAHTIFKQIVLGESDEEMVIDTVIEVEED